LGIIIVIIILVKIIKELGCSDYWSVEVSGSDVKLELLLLHDEYE
jgi:hypothetical protein